MRTRFWASVVLLVASLSASAADSIPLASGRTITYSVFPGCTAFFIPNSNGSTSKLCLQRDPTVAENARPASVKLIGEISGAVVILTDTYPSMPGGMSYCQAGEEKFLRIIEIASEHPHETYTAKVESCRDNIELASPGLQWIPGTKSLNIRWISAPGQLGKAETRTLTVGPDGKLK
jgi:hypothetical protein